MAPVHIYVWSAPGDEAHRNTLVDTWLSPLVRDALARVHDDRSPPPGDDPCLWRQRTSSTTDLFLALVTAQLGASPIYKELLECYRRNPRIRLVPILVRPAILLDTVFDGLVPIPNELRRPKDPCSELKTIVEYDPVDSGWREVAKRIRALIPIIAAEKDHKAFIAGEPSMPAQQTVIQKSLQTSAQIVIGSRIDGRFKVLEQPSTRAGSAVLSAWDGQEQQVVMLHVLGALLAGDGSIRDGIFNRVDAWSRLSGTGMVPVLQARGQDGSRYYFVSAMAEGTALLDMVLRETLPRAAVVPLVVSLALELERLHTEGYVHGNVRPQEVFVHRDGTFRLGPPHPLVGVDLMGLLGEAVGPSSGYWAPELHQAPRAIHAPDARIDVYGLALTGAVALSGWYPLPAGLLDPIGIVDGLVSVDREVKRVLRRALSAAPEDRHETMKAFRLDLVRAHRAAHPTAPAEMVLVPGGKIRMVWDLAGRIATTPKRAQWADVGSFWLGKYPVTQAQYEAIMGVNPSAARGPDHPVTRVSFRDALEFCNRLSVLEGRDPMYTYVDGRAHCRWEGDGYRLPTEAEWELAARGEVGRTFAWGDDPPGARACWNGEGNAEGALNRTGTCAVNAHPLGATPAQSATPDSCIWDMTGNVWEWCWDYLGPYAGFEGEEPKVLDPTGPSHPEVPLVPNPVPGALNRILRGGSWKDVREPWMHASARNTDDERVRQDGVGFRLARGPHRGGG